MMIDAIFIQSWHGEVLDGSLSRLLVQIHEKVDTPVPVWTFVDNTSLKHAPVVEQLKTMQQQGLTCVEFVDDTQYKNAQTTVFYHMLRSKISQYPRVLLLEADCKLSNHFDTPIIQDIQSLDNWWICGSTYYGTGGGELEQDTNQLRRNHLNGVAVYNRTPEYLRYAKLVFETECGRDNKLAFDWLFAMRFFQSEHKHKPVCYDSPYIINLSPIWDQSTVYNTRKPHATIVHQKQMDMSFE